MVTGSAARVPPGVAAPSANKAVAAAPVRRIVPERRSAFAPLDRAFMVNPLPGRTSLTGPASAGDAAPVPAPGQPEPHPAIVGPVRDGRSDQGLSGRFRRPHLYKKEFLSFHLPHVRTWSTAIAV